MHKTVGLDEQAYQMLRAAKRPGESFSDTVRRLLGVSGSWREMVGILGPEGDAMAKWLETHRAQQRADAVRKWAGRREDRP